MMSRNNPVWLITGWSTGFGRELVLYGYPAAIEEGEDDAVRDMFEANVFGPVDMTKTVLPTIRA